MLPEDKMEDVQPAKSRSAASEKSSMSTGKKKAVTPTASKTRTAVEKVSDVQCHALDDTEAFGIVKTSKKSAGTKVLSLVEFKKPSGFKMPRGLITAEDQVPTPSTEPFSSLSEKSAPSYKSRKSASAPKKAAPSSESKKAAPPSKSKEVLLGGTSADCDEGTTF
jgi:hypothetical protein